jgi:hypothetical protein
MSKISSIITGSRVLLAIWIIGVAAVIIFGFRDNPYLTNVRGFPPPHPYPYQTVGSIMVLITIETGLLWAILRPASYNHSWGRSLLGFGISFCFLIFGSWGAMHVPPAWTTYMYWLFVVSAGLLIQAVRAFFVERGEN